MSKAPGFTGNTVADLIEVAEGLEEGAKFCEEHGEPELAQRDRRLAAAMRMAAAILDAPDDPYAPVYFAELA